MRFTINKGELQTAIEAPCKIAMKAVVDFAGCLLVQADFEGVAFEATNMVDSVRIRTMALVEDEGRAMIPAKQLMAIVKTLPDEAVTIEADGEGCHISCGKSSFSLRCLDPDLFPAFPKVEGDQVLRVKGYQFENAMKPCISFASKDDSRPAQCCIHVKNGDGKLVAEATDSYRAIRSKVDANDTPFEALIPAAFVAGLSYSPDDDVEVAVSGKQVRVSAGASTWITRTVEAKYPNVGMILDRERPITAEVRDESLIGAVKRAASVGKGNSTLKLAIRDGAIDVSLDEEDMGSMSEDLQAITEGEAEAYMNVSYALGALGLFQGRCLVEMSSSMDPIGFRNNSIRAVVMPVRA